MGFLHRIHQWLLPPRRQLGFLPYVWLLYLALYYFNFFFKLPSPPELILSILATLVFLVLYFSAYRRQGLALALHILAFFLIGALCVFINLGASVFMVYAASFCAQFPNAKHGFTGVLLIIVGIGLYALIFQLPLVFYAPAMFFALLVGGTNIYFADTARKNFIIKKSQQEIQQLATIAERERIARDLHDLIGHTFSLITRKAELAQKLLKIDVQKAESELADIENESRQALSQVREAVSGYRTTTLENELTAAKYLCEAAELEFQSDIPQLDLPDHINHAFAYILKEAMTNICRHSEASIVRVLLNSKDQHLMFYIQDNGNAQDLSYGNGLTGIKERVESLNGEFSVNIDNGVKLQIEVPYHV
ncbi:histidine kinase [Glaciecola sp. 1036]|uniref:sensor histidine kinase n=1 Tax=Alteromonadaceae TaxID=72275 RepID=UPI003D030047